MFMKHVENEDVHHGRMAFAASRPFESRSRILPAAPPHGQMHSASRLQEFGGKSDDDDRRKNFPSIGYSQNRQVTYVSQNCNKMSVPELLL